MKAWKRIEPTVATKIGYRTVLVKHFIQPNGRLVDWTVLNEDGWAAACAVALTPENKAIVVHQFRAGPEKMCDDLPGGIVDASETPEACVVRELAEETGYQPGKVEYLGFCHYDANVNGKRHYFLLTDCTLTGAGKKLDDDEHNEVRLISIDELIKASKTARMTDPGGVLLAYDRLKALTTENKRSLKRNA